MIRRSQAESKQFKIFACVRLRAQSARATTPMRQHNPSRPRYEGDNQGNRAAQNREDDPELHNQTIAVA